VTPSAEGLRAGGSGEARRSLVAGLVIVAVSAGWALLVDVDHRFISFSDGAYTYIASVVAARGAHVLYSPVVFSQPPLTLLGAALVWRASPHIEAIRAVLAALAGLRSLLTYAVGRVLGLARGAATTAAIIALTAPVRVEFSGLDGEALLGPIALAIVWLAFHRRFFLVGVLAGIAPLIKLTCAPALLLLVVVLALRDRRALWQVVLAATVSFTAVVATLFAAFGWHPSDVFREVVFAQLHSGYQPVTAIGVVLVLALLWWPLLALVPAGLRAMPGVRPLLAAVTVLLLLETLKNGTFFNVLDPVEPFLAIAAVAGAIALWRGRTGRARVLVVVCSVGVCLHIASLSDGTVATAIPFPLGAAFVNTDDQAEVDAIARTIDLHSRPDQPVLTNPFFALVAHRSEVGDQGDWFILHALQDYCGGAHAPATACNEWATVTAEAKRGDVPVVSVDSNVVSFDKAFRAEVGTAAMRGILSVDKPPIKSTIYIRAPAHSRRRTAR
jgi:hypothetical protein